MEQIISLIKNGRFNGRISDGVSRISIIYSTLLKIFDKIIL